MGTGISLWYGENKCPLPTHFVWKGGKRKLNLNVKVKDKTQVLAAYNSKVVRLNFSSLSHLDV